MTQHSCSRIAKLPATGTSSGLTDDDGGFEMAIFSGPRARERAVIFAERCYGRYDEVRSHQGLAEGFADPA